MIGIFVRVIDSLGPLLKDEDKDIYHDNSRSIQIYSTDPSLVFDSLFEKLKAREIRDFIVDNIERNEYPHYGYNGDYGTDGKREQRCFESMIVNILNRGFEDPKYYIFENIPTYEYKRAISHEIICEYHPENSKCKFDVTSIFYDVGTFSADVQKMIEQDAEHLRDYEKYIEIEKERNGYLETIKQLQGVIEDAKSRINNCNNCINETLVKMQLSAIPICEKETHILADYFFSILKETNKVNELLPSINCFLDNYIHNFEYYSKWLPSSGAHKLSHAHINDLYPINIAFQDSNVEFFNFIIEHGGYKFNNKIVFEYRKNYSPLRYIGDHIIYHPCIHNAENILLFALTSAKENLNNYKILRNHYMHEFDVIYNKCKTMEQAYCGGFISDDEFWQQEIKKSIEFQDLDNLKWLIEKDEELFIRVLHKGNFTETIQKSVQQTEIVELIMEELKKEFPYYIKDSKLFPKKSTFGKR